MNTVGKSFFEGFEFARTNFEDHGVIPENMNKEFKVIQLINGYRNRGHLFTKTNPVRERRKYKPDLSLENFGLSQDDLKTSFNAGEEVGLGAANLQEIVNHLEENLLPEYWCRIHLCQTSGSRGLAKKIK